MIKKIPLFILCIILLFNLSHSALFDIFPDDVCGGDLNAFMSSWAVTCYIAIMISLLILLIIFLICRGMQIQKGETWAKYEMLQVGATVLILLVIVGFSEFILCSGGLTPKMIFGNVLGAGDDSMVVEAKDYLTTLMRMNTISLTSILFFNIQRETIGNFKFSVDIIGLGIGITPGKGLNSLNRVFEIAQIGIITMLVTSITQLMLFNYVYAGMFTIYLPIGILLRCFEPTRRFGGTLIGLTIALGLFWPMLLVINSVALQGIGVFGMWEGIIEFVAEQMQANQFINLHINSPADMFDGNIHTSAPITFKIGIIEPMKIMFSALSMATWKMLAINILGSLFLPLLNFAILATSMREFSRFFGEQIDLSNLTRMI
ncbi:hypothetical protein KO317_02090 [Candidatus Micrarchaeota archaeon]|nr:hypothetical protein [Candidatus Micrarchaeota archaeon]